MAANLKELFQGFTARIGEKIRDLQTQINTINSGGGSGSLSPNAENSLTLDESGAFYFKQRTPAEIATAYEGIEGVNRFSNEYKQTVDNFVSGLTGKSDLDPATGKLRTDQVPNFSITNVIRATENTLAGFMANNLAYTFDEGDAIVIVSLNAQNETVRQHYLYDGGDRSLAASYEPFTAKVIWDEIEGKPVLVTEATYNLLEARVTSLEENGTGGGTTAKTELISIIPNWELGTRNLNPTGIWIEENVQKTDARPLTVAAADPTFDRFDLLGINLTTDQLEIITGTAGNPAPEPTYDPLTFLPGPFISMKAGATSPEGVAGLTVYDGENPYWPSTNAGPDFDLLNPESPASGTYAIKAINPLINSQSIPFVAPVAKAWEEGMEIAYKIKNITGGSYQWLVQGTKSNGRAASLFIDAPFNYSVSSLVYQSLSVVIPSGLVNITKISLVSRVDGLQYFLDDVKLVTGGGTVSTGEYADLNLSNINQLTVEQSNIVKQKLNIVETSGVTQQYVDEADALKISISAIVDDLTSIAANAPLSANQGRVLKGFIDDINTLLTSNDTTLDELQEIVTYIKQNKTTLDTLGIPNIAGLVDALALKVDKVAGKQLSTEDFTTTLLNKLNSITEIFTTALKSSYDTAATWVTNNGQNVLDHIIKWTTPTTAGKMPRTIEGGGIEWIDTPAGGASVSGIRVYNVETYGAVHDGVTDDTPAIQTAIQACFDGGGGIVYFPNGIYAINGALDTASNSQLYFPLSSYSNSINLKTIKLLGETSPNQFSNPFNDAGATDHTNNGVILKSNLLGAGNIIGARDQAVSWGNYNFIKVIIENVSVRIRSITGTTDVAPQATGINMGNVAAYVASHIEVCTTSKMHVCQLPATSCSGVIMPKTNNFTFSSMTNFNIYGVYKAVDCYEHTHLDAFLIDVCYIGLKFNAVNHSIHVNKGCISRSVINIQTQGASYFLVDHLSVEDDYNKVLVNPSWNKTLYDIENLDNLASGSIRMHIVAPNVGTDYSVFKTSTENTKIKTQRVNGDALGYTLVLADGLLAYWKFEESTGNFIDSSPNGRNATRINSPTSAAGKLGNALTLANNTQAINAGSVGLSNTGAITFTGWFKINTTAAAFQTLFNKGDATGREYNCYFTKSTSQITFVNYNGTAVSGSVTLSSIPLDTPFFLCCEIIGTSIKMARNNGAAVVGTAAVPSSATAKDFYLANSSLLNEGVVGYVDDFAIHSRELTAAEKSARYNNGNGAVIL